MDQKSIGCPFFPKRLFSNTLLSCPYIVKQRPFSQKNIVISYHFFKFFMKNPLLSYPYLVKKNYSVKTTLYYGPKKSIGCPYFPIFQEKIIAFMPIFCKKSPFFKKHTDVMPIFCRKNVHPLKNTVLPCHFFNFFMKKLLLSCPYLVKETLILSKLHYIMG